MNLKNIIRNLQQIVHFYLLILLILFDKAVMIRSKKNYFFEFSHYLFLDIYTSTLINNNNQ